jgi:hypothetical protein
MEIGPKEISVIIQGPVIGPSSAAPEARLTHRCIESVRRHLPAAQIILSTYHDSDVRGLHYDVLVENDDPGAVLQNDVLHIANNVNRQIVTTRNGLRAADRRFALKLRSDLLLEGTGWQTQFGAYPRRCRQWRVFEERLISCTVYARNPRSLCRFPFHPSDWLYFGLRDDMMQLWDIPLAPEPETSRWFEHRPRPVPDAVPSNLCRYVPEQYIWTTCLRKHGALDFEHCHDYSHGAVELTELTFANNLILLEPRQLKMRCFKRRVGWRDWCTLYSHTDWLLMYHRFCDSSRQKLPSRWRQAKRWMWLCSVPALKAARRGRLQLSGNRSRAAGL